MNEQIKELAIRAVKNSILEPMHPAITVGEGANKMEIPLIFAEKFAELIINECVTACDELEAKYISNRKNTIDFSEKNIYAEGEAALRAVRFDIKKQFGIKQ